MVASRRHVAYGELSAVVGQRHALQFLLVEGGVGKIALQPHHDALHWLQSAGVKHVARHAHRVDDASGREGECEVVDSVALVVVLD